MAATMTYGYGIPPILGDHISSTTRFPQYQYADNIISARSSLGRDVPAYGHILTSQTSYLENKPSTASIIAVDEGFEAYDTSRKTVSRQTSAGSKKRSLERSRTQQLSTSASNPCLSSSAPRNTGAKDRFKSNLKRIAQQKEYDPTALDLSKTAEENEKISGINIYSQRPGSQSATDVRFVPTSSRRRHNTFATVNDINDIESYKPSAPFMRSGPRPVSATRSHVNSMTASDYSGGDAYTSYRPSFSSRPSFPAATDRSASSLSLRSLNRPRGGTNGSSTAVSPPATKSRKSFDRAFKILTRKDSADTLNDTSRVANIQAARQAFDKRQEEKDAKYEKRAAKDRERKEKQTVTRERRPSFLSHKSSQTKLGNEKGSECLEGVEYSAYPERRMSSKAADREVSKMSTARKARSRYAAFLSWIRTKILNIGRRSRRR